MRLVRDDPGLPLYNTTSPKGHTFRRIRARARHWFSTRNTPTKACIIFTILLSIFVLITICSQGEAKREQPIVENPEIIINEQVIAGQKTKHSKEESAENLKPVHDIDRQIVEDEMDAPETGGGNEKIVKFTGPTNDRQKAVVKAFQHAWIGYKKYAWGHDTLKPVSKSYSDWFDTGLTIVDGLDTAIIMGLEDEATEATEWIQNTLTFEKDRMVNFFECTIRVLGGMMSAFHLTGKKMFLEKSVDLGDRLLSAFKSPSPIPYSDVNLLKRTATNPQWGADSSLSEVTTVQLEYRALSRASGNSTYEDLTFNVFKHIHKIGCETHEGLCGMFINANTGNFKKDSTITFGARSDSFYEYLFKQWIQTGKTIDWLKEDYGKAMKAMEKYLYRNSKPNKMFFIGELLSGQTYSPKMDHLVCFIAGTLSQGSQHGFPRKHLDMAEKIGETCHNMYDNPTGLGPEIAHFNMIPGKEDLYVKPLDAHCLLRPEAIEAWFYLYRFTGDKKYQEWGWSAFQAIEKYARIPTGGYSSISNVKQINVRFRDSMESFLLGETFKYLYLLLGDDQTVLPLDKWVFTTEGHPLPIYDH
ncbi:alpha-1,2-Mannosidase [Caenorhabditis elegans]|uniref:alpha-1,2-Mannosidase n=1 Tax=Caenorhabditis elegans TaxID=6239 RepID=Q22120_CAEEL|nr:alpha-1,2-Mannosidase [Caenorhabditis elegans]CCD68813.1 alpha-1,2-Mannosidase [Caenorhabditis elegans]|eukprot:NP_508877.1 alpha-1,2-Mannosidase [Caenorhabditis elegans]